MDITTSETISMSITIKEFLDMQIDSEEVT